MASQRLLSVLLVLVMGLASASTHGATETRTVNAQATGIDYEQAVFNALSEAVRQVRGAQISASRQVQSSLGRISTRGSGDSESTTTVSAAQSSSTRVRSSGLISGYRVLSVTDASGGGKLAKLQVDLPVYKVPGSSAQDNRWRMAVYPVEVTTGLFQVNGQQMPGRDVSERLTHSISNALTRSRRFAMLARDNDDAIYAERERIAGKDVPVAEKAMLGNTLGAEYLVVTRVTDFSLSSEQLTSSLTGEISQVSKGAAVLELRVLAPATGAIVWSQTLNADARQLGVDLAGDSSSGQQVFDSLGREVALRVVDAVWPPLVEENSGGQLVINMGGGLLKPGEQWEVFALGKAVRNSHTGAGLGREEHKVATVTISRNTDKLSYATILDGSVEGKGHVLRRNPQHLSAADPAEAIRGTRKRTCLPMDPC